MGGGVSIPLSEKIASIEENLAELQHKFSSVQTHLPSSLQRNTHERVRIFLEKHHQHINNCTPTEIEATSLYTAIQEGNLEFVKVLLLEANVDSNRGHGIFSPLYLAAKLNKKEVVALLLQDPSIDLFRTDRFHQTAYDVTTDDEIKEMLVAAFEARGFGSKCAICLEHPVNQSLTFYPCNHTITCTQCNHLLDEFNVVNCPLCRAEIWFRTAAEYG